MITLTCGCIVDHPDFGIFCEWDTETRECLTSQCAGMRLVRSVRDVIDSLLRLVSTHSLILLTVHEQVKNVNTLATMKIKLND